MDMNHTDSEQPDQDRVHKVSFAIPPATTFYYVSLIADMLGTVLKLHILQVKPRDPETEPPAATSCDEQLVSNFKVCTYIVYMPKLCPQNCVCYASLVCLYILHVWCACVCICVAYTVPFH